MAKKLRGSLLFYFIICLIGVNVLDFLLTAGVTAFMMHRGAFEHPRPTIFTSPFMLLLASSIVTGFIMTTIVAQRVFAPISKMGKAMKQVAEGDFSVRLNTKHITRETEEICEGFNAMVQELGTIEELGRDFISNVSHEFKTPAAAIEGYAELLMADDSPPDERKEYSQAIIESARQLSGLTSNILKLTRLESETLAVENKPYGLDEQLRRVILLLEKEWTAKNLTLDIHLPPCTICANEELLYQVWLNLLQNAIRFTPQGGAINISTRCSAGFAYVAVKDTGVGITPEAQKHIFDRFYQADKTRFTQGSGLGLALVKRILELQHGSIEVQSEPGKGTTFQVVLPQHLK